MNKKTVSSSQMAGFHTFAVVSKYNSFALAAAHLSITPSAVSHRIKNLEDDLGVSLFVRSHRKIMITNDGSKLLKIVSEYTNRLSEEIFEILSDGSSGSIKVYSRPSIAHAIIAPQVGDFLKKNPSIEFNLKTGNRKLTKIDADIDIEINFDNNPLKSMDNTFLMHEYLLPVCSLKYAEEKNLNDNLNAIAECTLLHDRDSGYMFKELDEWESWLRKYNLYYDNKKGLNFDQSELALKAAIGGAGIALGRRCLIKNLIDQGVLISPFKDMELKCPQFYYASTPPGERKTKVKNFINWLKSL